MIVTRFKRSRNGLIWQQGRKAKEIRTFKDICKELDLEEKGTGLNHLIKNRNTKSIYHIGGKWNRQIREWIFMWDCPADRMRLKMKVTTC